VTNPLPTALALSRHGEAAGAAAALLGAVRFGLGAAAAPLVSVLGNDDLAMAATMGAAMVGSLLIVALIRGSPDDTPAPRAVVAARPAPAARLRPGAAGPTPPTPLGRADGPRRGVPGSGRWYNVRHGIPNRRPADSRAPRAGLAAVAVRGRHPHRVHGGHDRAAAAHAPGGGGGGHPALGLLRRPLRPGAPLAAGHPRRGLRRARGRRHRPLGAGPAQGDHRHRRPGPPLPRARPGDLLVGPRHLPVHGRAGG